MSSTRSLNIKTVVDTIRENGPIARKQISRVTHLSVPTVWRVIDDLLDAGLVREVAPDVAPKRRGPKTALVEINPGSGWVAAIEIAGERIRASAMDLTGHLLNTVEQALLNVHGEESVSPVITSTLTELLKKSKASLGKPLGIGASSVGIIDPEAGIVRLSFNLQLKDFQLARLLNRICDVPVTVHNDVASSALAEARLGAGRTSPDFGYITVGTGIGANYVFDRRVHDYENRSEFGLMIVAPEGDPERFEGRGFLESLASGRGIAAAARRALENGTHSLISELTPQGPAFITPAIVLDAARRHDPLAEEILARAANYLAIGIVNVANILRLKRFVIDGTIPKAGDVFWKPLAEAVRKHEYWPGEIQLLPSELQGEAAILGAGLLALDNAFDRIVSARKV